MREHQGSRRVGPPQPVPSSCRGIVLLPIIFILACIGTAAEFGYMFYCMATGR